MLILFMNLQSVQGTTKTVYFCSTQHLPGQLKGWWLKSSEKLTRSSVFYVIKTGKTEPASGWNSWGSSGIPSNSRESSHVISLIWWIQGLWTQGSQGTGHKKGREPGGNYCLSWPHLESHSVIPLHSISPSDLRNENTDPHFSWKDCEIIL